MAVLFSVTNEKYAEKFDASFDLDLLLKRFLVISFWPTVIKMHAASPLSDFGY